MKFRSFFWTLTTGAITIFLIGVVCMGWIASSSSIALLPGGVNRFPLAAAFIPKQAPAMFSLLTNPEKLNALYRVTLPLQERQRERLEWQQWEADLLSKIGFDYQRDVKPWLGDEITLAIASLDGDRNPRNGAQPGYILAAATKNTSLAKESLRQFYSTKNNISIESYKGTNIFFPNVISDFWSSVVVGDFVLFANQPQILKEAINQAQAVNLNLEQADSYQTVLSNIQQPHIGVGYVDVFGLSAWLDKSEILTKVKNKPTLGVSLSIKGVDLAAQTISIDVDNGAINSLDNKSFLDNSELQQILNSLPYNDRNLAYIEIKNGRSLLEDRIPLYKVTKLAIQSLFPHLKAIAIQNIGKKDRISRANILFKLDS